MGNFCGFNIFDYLMKNYGEDFVKFISIEKSKGFLEEKFTQLKGKTSEEAGKVKEEAFGKIDEQEKELDKEFENAKTKLNGKAPGGIEAVEKLKGDSIDNIMGFKAFKNEFQELKKTTGEKFDEEEKVVQKSIDNAHAEEEKAMDQQKPKLPLYDQLPQEQKKEVLQKGQQEFAKQIKQHQAGMEKDLEKKLDPANYLGNMKNIGGGEAAEGKVKQAKEKFEEMHNALSGGLSFGGLF